jgi:tetratricopeptide (TPR) repeat protein
MRPTTLLAALSAALLHVGLAPAAEPRVGRYVSFDAGDFTIVTSRSGDQARQFMQNLAKFRLALEKTLGKRATRTVFPTTIVIANDNDWKKFLMPREGIAGFFQQGHFVNYMAMDGDAPRAEAEHIIFHEYTHFYLASQFAGEYPPWFNEGLAEVMGYAKFTNDGMAILQLPIFHVHEARDGDWIPFERLIQVSQNSPEYQSHKLANSFYAQAWLTVHYGFVENREFGQQITNYLAQLNTLRPQEEAARTAFGADLAAVDKQLRDYSRATRMSSGAIALGEVPPFALPEGKPVDDADAIATLIDVMLEEHLYPERIRPLLESLARREPAAARPAIYAARLALATQDNTAFDAAVTKAEGLLAPGDWLEHRELASVLLESARDVSPMTTRTSEESQRDLKRAMKWFGEAIAHNPEDVEALWGFGTAATELDLHLDVAEGALRSAYLRAPGSADIAMSLASLKSHQDKPDEMVPYLKDTIRYASNLETRHWAVTALERLQVFIAERDRNEAQTRKQREEYEKRLADHEKKYGKTKQK